MEDLRVFVPVGCFTNLIGALFILTSTGPPPWLRPSRFDLRTANTKGLSSPFGVLTISFFRKDQGDLLPLRREAFAKSIPKSVEIPNN